MPGDLPPLLRPLLSVTVGQMGSSGGVLVQHQSSLFNQPLTVRGPLWSPSPAFRTYRVNGFLATGSRSPGF